MEQDYVSTWLFSPTLTNLDHQLKILTDAHFVVLSTVITATVIKALIRGTTSAYIEFLQTKLEDIPNLSRSALTTKLVGLTGIRDITLNVGNSEHQVRSVNKPQKIGIIHPNYSTYDADLQHLPRIQEIWLTNKLGEVRDYELSAGLQCLGEDNEVCLIHVNPTQSNLETGISTCIYHKCAVVIYTGNLDYTPKYLNQIQFLLKQNPGCLFVANDQLGLIPEVLSIRETKTVGLDVTELSWNKPEYQNSVPGGGKLTPDAIIPRTSQAVILPRAHDKLTPDTILPGQSVYMESDLIDLFRVANYLSRLDSLQGIHTRMYAGRSWQPDIGLGDIRTLFLTPDESAPIPSLNPEVQSSLIATVNNSIVDTLNTVLYDMIKEVLTGCVTAQSADNLGAMKDIYPKLVQELNHSLTREFSQYAKISQADLSERMQAIQTNQAWQVDRVVNVLETKTLPTYLDMITDLIQKLDAKSASLSPRTRSLGSNVAELSELIRVNNNDQTQKLNEVLTAVNKLAIDIRTNRDAAVYAADTERLHIMMETMKDQVSFQVSMILQTLETWQSSPRIDSNIVSPKMPRLLSRRPTVSTTVVGYQLRRNARVNETRLLPGSHMLLSRNNRQLHWTSESRIVTIPASGHIFPSGYTSVKVTFPDLGPRNDFTFTVQVK